MKRKKSLRAAAESTHTAADRRDAANRAAQAISDYAQTFGPALEHGRERLQPLLDTAQDKVHPYLEQAQDAVSPYLEQAQDRAKHVRTEGAKRANQALKTAAPVINDTLDKVSPVVDTARGRVQSDLLPKLQDALEVAAGTELGKKAIASQKDAAKQGRQALKKGQKSVAKLQGKVVEPEKSHKGLKTVGVVALVAAIAGGGYVAFKKFFAAAPQDDPWKAYEPSSPFAKPPAGPSDPVADQPPTDEAAETFDRLDPEPVSDPIVTEDVAPTPSLDTDTDLGANDHADTEAGNAVPATAGYGEGSYVGIEPPEGFSIKGNERSMKYHTEGSSGFDRTIADVWFASEEAAEKAGFSRAQR